MVHPKDKNYPHPTSRAVTSSMRSNRRADTKTEVAIRSLLHKRGFRYRKDFVIKLCGRNCRPDIVFTKIRLAVFVDGCFWHCCPEHGHIPKSNVHYWGPKLRANRERDIADTALLEGDGWAVLRLWEHMGPSEAAAAIVTEINRLYKEKVVNPGGRIL